MWAKSLQSSATLCDPMDSSLPGSSLSIGFSRQEYRSGLPCLPPVGIFNPGIEPESPAFEADSLPLASAGKPIYFIHIYKLY